MTTGQTQTMERNETKLVGYTVTVSLNEDIETGIIVSLREKLSGQIHEIANRSDDKGIYLVQVYPDGEWTPDVAFESIIAVEVSEYNNIPEEFVQRSIPAGSYIKITHNGPESQIAETYDSIREKGIGACRTFDFEYWADIESLEKEESIIDIYLPVVN